MYIWERPDWPDLTWDSAHVAALLGQASREQGRLLGRMQDLGFDLRREAQLNTLTEDVVSSSEIEGEKLDSDQVSIQIRTTARLNASMLSRYISLRRLRINSCQRLPNAPAAHTTSASATAYHPKRAAVDSERPRHNAAAAASSGAITM